MGDLSGSSSIAVLYQENNLEWILNAGLNMLRHGF
jgi:hypothetical protein